MTSYWFLLVAIGACTVEARVQPLAVQIHIDLSKPIATVAAQYVGFNVDAASLYEETTPNGRLDFQSPDLLSLARRLASAGPGRTTLRIGGSSADDLGWGSNATGQRINVEPSYWDSILEFVRSADLELVWDLNAMKMRTASGAWNASQAEALLRHVSARPWQRERLRALQLGNEPGHFFSNNPGTAPNATQHAHDFVELSALVQRVAPPSAETGRIKVQGPDVCFGKGVPGPTGADKCANLSYFETVLSVAGAALDEVSVHDYGLRGPHPPQTDDCSVAAFTDPALWEANLRPVLRAWRAAQLRTAPHAKLILSETATAGDGGCHNLSNSFAAGFYWLDTLGSVAREGYWQVYRQDLVGFSGINGGSSYALLGDPGWVGGTLEPNPDYFSTLLWKQLMGRVVLNVTTAVTGVPHQFRAYAACLAPVDASPNGGSGSGSGGVAIAYINPGDADVDVTIVAATAPLGARAELYVLTSGGGAGHLDSRFVRLNGGASLQSGSALDPVTIPLARSAAVSLPRLSYGFVVLPDAQASACID